MGKLGLACGLIGLTVSACGGTGETQVTPAFDAIVEAGVPTTFPSTPSPIATMVPTPRRSSIPRANAPPGQVVSGSSGGEQISPGYEPPVAFPGAEGFGAHTPGGRSGRVIVVTNLLEDGPGSLREALEADGPRTVLFDVAGTIKLHRPIGIENPYITVDGQSAPAPGITIMTDYEFRISNTHDVVIRYLRIRQSGKRATQDAVTIFNSHHVILDHCSLSWGTDETLNIVRGSHDVTVQWCVISEPVGQKSFSILVNAGPYRLSLHHNLIAHGSERNPKLEGTPELLDGNDPVFDFVNNVVYNWNDYAVGIAGNGQANIVSNYFKVGPDTSNWPKRAEIMLWQQLPGQGVFTEGNIGPTCPSGCADEWAAGMISSLRGERKTRLHVEYRARPFETLPITTQPAEQAFEAVLQGAGAVLPSRDMTDARVVASVRDGTGSLVKDDAQLANLQKRDEDEDGLLDRWELTHGLNPYYEGDRYLDSDCDGRTNIEEFLNGTNPTSVADGRFCVIAVDSDELGVVVRLSGPIDSSTGVSSGSITIDNGAIVTDVVVGDSDNTIALTTSSLVEGTLYALQVEGLVDADGRELANPTFNFVHEGSSLIGAWSFDQAGPVKDSGRRANLGKAVGARWTSEDCLSGGCYAFDGGDDYIDLGTGSSLEGFIDLTILAWVRTSSTSSQRIVQQRMKEQAQPGNTGIDGQLVFEVDGAPTGTLRFVIWDGRHQCGDGNFNSTGTVNDGEWHHVAAVRRGTECQIYIDGALDSSASAEIIGKIMGLDSGISMYVGANKRDEKQFFDGLIDEVAILEVALNGEQISDHMNESLTRD